MTEQLKSHPEPQGRGCAHVEAVAVDDMVDDLFDTLDDMMLVGDFGGVDDTLDAIDADHADFTLLIAALCITLPARCLLNSRAGFFERVRGIAKNTHPPHIAERMLEGLE